jgi:hypothetical protein
MKLLASRWTMAGIIFLLLTPLVNGIGIGNTLVSLQYETLEPGQCISLVSGRNLCADLQSCKYSALGFLLLAISLIVLHSWAIEKAHRKRT